MPGTLFDTNVWLAALFNSHPFHALAQRALREATPAQPAVFCRATQQNFWRLACTPALLKVYGAEGFSNREAWVALDALQALAQVRVHDEPPGTFALWRTLANADTAAPKVWMDAYLAAFAIAGSLRLVTFDQDFNKFAAQGLEFRLISG